MWRWCCTPQIERGGRCRQRRVDVSWEVAERVLLAARGVVVAVARKKGVWCRRPQTRVSVEFLALSELAHGLHSGLGIIAVKCHEGARGPE